MNNINEEGRFYRTSKQAFGSNYYPENKTISLSFKLSGILVVILLLIGFL